MLSLCAVLRFSLDNEYPSYMDEGRSSPLGWAFYLGISWTWCIGMFLPVLLVRDLGNQGFWIFALPNVLGAAAMGWVLQSKDQSLQITLAHRFMCGAFSWVTILFQLFFLHWMVGQRLLDYRFVALGYLLVALIGLFSGLRGQRAPMLAVLVFVLSLVLFYLSLQRGATLASPWAEGRLSPIHNFFLAPVCVFGFLFCPYLDLTFHRARQNTTLIGARIAFTLGFAVIFFLMLFYSLAYARPAAGLLRPLPAFPPRLVPLLATHFLFQLGFTIVAHLTELASVDQTDSSQRAHRSRLDRVLVLLALLLIPHALAYFCRTPSRPFMMDAGELIYRIFLAFYGLIFPAYVYLAILHSPINPATRRTWIVFISACLLATPFYFLGFVMNHIAYLLPGLFLVLISRQFLAPLAAQKESTEAPQTPPRAQTP